MSATTGLEQVENGAAAGFSRVSVYDASGRLVCSKASASVAEAVEGLAGGMYVVKTVGADGKTSTLKVLK